MLLHRFFIENGRVKGIEWFKPNTGIEIYEVIRMIEGIPLFLEDHLSRFYHSAWLCHLEIPLVEDDILSMLKELISVNGIKEGNIRFSFTFRPTGNFQAYFIPHHYPDETMVKEGVTCGLYFAERQDPNAKVVHTNLRETADRLIADQGFYEVLLVNREGKITEGSRSNVFFMKEGNFFTAPAEDVLPGITRQKVLELLTESGLPIKEQSLSATELTAADAAFLTGTSPKILPVRSIGDLTFPVGHPGVKSLVNKYNRLIEMYIQNARKLMSPSDL